MTGGDYTRADLIKGLRTVGIGRGDTVFVHVCHTTLGRLAGVTTCDDASLTILDVLREAIGEAGTILVPTYSFSFCRQEIFDVQNSPTAGGPWSSSVEFLEYFRMLPGVVRSGEPIHSVAGLGPRAEEMLLNLPPTCFGAGSVHERLMKAEGKVCMIGVDLGEATFRHYAEELMGVPFRFKKLFTGYVRDNGQLRKEGWIYNVRIMAENGYPDGSRLEARARELGICRVATVGLGEVLAVDTRAYFELAIQEIRKDPWYTAKGPAGDPIEMEKQRVGGPRYDVKLPASASFEDLIDNLWHLPRDIVSDAYDAALDALASQVPMTVHEYPTGSDCWGWILPEKWICHEAYLETLHGERLFSYADHPLHVVSYSLPFEGIVSREVLFQHLHTDPKLPDAIPFKFSYYERDWGLCCSQRVKKTLTDESYRVVIKTDFSYAVLRVGEVVAQGRSDECIVLCAHLCHPGMVNDDLTGVAVGLEVIKALLKRRDLYFTYRLVIVPETIGSIAYLSANEDLIPSMKGGLFLEMLGREHPHALQLSFTGNTELDRRFTEVMKKHDPNSWAGPYRSIIGNDERQYNGPGVRVPMLSLSRVLPASSQDWPYVGYHSSVDNPDLISLECLRDSCDLVLEMVDSLETSVVPINKFKGEAFCSRYGIFIDWAVNPEASGAFFDVMALIDGTMSIEEVAEACHVSPSSVQAIAAQLANHGLAEYRHYVE
jgi:aminopeptidase-like protein/aminoglycoside N3'-acetyltransferase